ncbi:hypothetical protein [Methylobacter sp. BBA5.1]|jgi:hypothetical protein|uniref:hypothetical protein n=1 Tax=Methylobacter sp. BBA5.1 TaxID=1495064 RepID=UPI00055D93DB|nr:hypothetical protein [Methylobacter sp. BBA5.1]
MKKKACNHEYLALTAFGEVSVCRECAIVHLHVLNVTLRFSVDNFLGLADTLTEASKKLRTVAKKKPERRSLTLIK